MIRLTAMLVVCLFGVMMVAGGAPDRPQGSDQPAEAVRAAPDPVLVAQEGAQPRLALADEAAAVALALEAGEKGPGPAGPAAVEAAVPDDAAADGAAVAAAAPGEAAETRYVTGSRVNLRAGPSTADAIVGQADAGAAATVIGERPDGWVNIRLDGAEAWIFGRFLDVRRPG